MARRHSEDCGKELDAGSQKPRFVETDGRGLHPGVDGDRLRKKERKITLATHFTFFTSFRRNMSLTSQLEIIQDLESEIKMIPCPTKAILIEKLNNIFEKNPDIKIIQMYGKILIGVSVDEHFPISP